MYCMNSAYIYFSLLPYTSIYLNTCYLCGEVPLSGGSSRLQSGAVSLRMRHRQTGYPCCAHCTLPGSILTIGDRRLLGVLLGLSHTHRILNSLGSLKLPKLPKAPNAPESSRKLPKAPESSQNSRKIPKLPEAAPPKNRFFHIPAIREPSFQLLPRAASGRSRRSFFGEFREFRTEVEG